MSLKEQSKITFYADPDVKKWLSTIAPGVKSHQINELLRQGFKRGTSTSKQIDILETRLKKLEQDIQFDGFAIATIRRVLLSHSGGQVAEELQKEFNDLFYSSGGIPPRQRW
jgi:methionine salvage enolase-phosphatase E1